jgi:hypothetical protein
VDEPAGVAQTDREHVAGCPVCLTGLAAAQEDAAVVGAALHATTTPNTAPGAALHASTESTVTSTTGALDASGAPDVDAGWERLSRAVAAEERQPRRSPRPARRWHTALRSPVVAVAGVVALLAGAGAAAAADWIPIFRAEQITPVTAPEADLVKLPDLADFGKLDVTGPVKIRAVVNRGAAEQATGLDVPEVSGLPRGVTGEPAYHVTDRATAVFTYSAETAARTAAAAGETLPAPPPGLDGSQFRLTAGPGVAAVWTAGRPVPAMVVGRVVAPTAFSSGIPFETARDYLLSLPILPKSVAGQLRNFSSDGTTLPLFMSAEELESSAADVNGQRATVFASRDGVLAGAVWVDDGIVTAVAGSLSTDEVLAVARGLR